MRINLISLTNDSIVSLNSAQNEYIVVPSISPTSILVIQKHSLFKQDTLSQSIDTLTLKHLDWPRIELFAGNTTNGQILDLRNLELRVGYKEEINSCIDFKSRIFKTTLFIPSTNQSFFLTGNQFTEEIIALFNTLDSGTKIELSTISSCNKLTRASFYLP